MICWAPRPPAWARCDRDCEALLLRGRWPAELRGRFYRNGPALFERGAERYHHWFDGDGMVQQFSIGEGRISHRGRLVRTAKLKAEQQAGRFLMSAVGTVIDGGPPASGPDSFNVLPALLGEKTPQPARDHLVLQNNGVAPLALREGDGTLLDNCLMMWGSGLEDGNKHSRENLPFIIAGKGGGSLNTGRYLTGIKGNQGDLLTTLLDSMGVPLDRPIGLATKKITQMQKTA